MKQGTVEQAKPGRARGQIKGSDENSPWREAQSSAETQDSVETSSLWYDSVETRSRPGRDTAAETDRDGKPHMC